MTRCLIALILGLTALPASVSPPVARGSGSAQLDSAVVKVCGPSFFVIDNSFWVAAVSEEHAVCLDELALRLQMDPRLSLVIDGHRDSGEPVGISINRASFHQRYLVEDKGIAPARISVRNFSDTCPHKAVEMALNARVEHWLMSRGSSATDINKLKPCADSSNPSVITTEKPLRWKGKWKSEALY